MRKVSPCNQHAMKDGRYFPIATLGTGTYGQVLRCSDNGDGGRHVAVKVAHREPAYRRSALNELRVLRLLCDVSEVVHIADSFEDDGRICIVSEILNKNMYEVLKDRSFASLPLEYVADIARVVLTALSALHAQGYMHCDIKPENVMLRGADDAFANTCVIDFGAVRQLRENVYYDIQSLWYRAPEVICGLPYTPLIDSWSVGCLLFELHTGNPLFPGDTPQEQLTSIISLLGLPSTEAMSIGKYAPNLVFALDCEGPHSPFHNSAMHENAAFREAFCDLLEGLLCPDEKRRLTCSEALRHPFFSVLQKPSKEVPPEVFIDEGGSGGMYDRDEDGMTSDDRQSTNSFQDTSNNSIVSMNMATPIKIVSPGSSSTCAGPMAPYLLSASSSHGSNHTEQSSPNFSAMFVNSPQHRVHHQQTEQRQQQCQSSESYEAEQQQNIHHIAPWLSSQGVSQPPMPIGE